MDSNDLLADVRNELERLRMENEELRQQRRSLLLTLFPPDPSAPFDPEQFDEIRLDELANQLEHSYPSLDRVRVAPE